jgi:hypothetical protein
VAVTVVAAGCNQLFGLDPISREVDGGGGSADAAGCTGGSDEDEDGIPDPCDSCPHVFDAGGADRDQDGVGDACDPHPDLGGDRVLFFDGFAGPAPWSSQTWRAGGGALVQGEPSAADALALRDGALPPGVLVELGLSIDGFDAAVDAAAIGAWFYASPGVEGDTTGYLCQVRHDGVSPTGAITLEAWNDFAVLPLGAGVGPRLAAGADYRLQVGRDPVSQRLTCQVIVDGNKYGVDEALDATFPSGTIGVRSDHVAARLRYAIAFTTEDDADPTRP